MAKEQDTKTSERFSNLLMAHPICSILLALAIVLPSMTGLMYLKSDFGIRIWFRDGDPHLKAFDHFERLFGNDESIVVIVHDKKGIFNPSTVATLQNLHDQFEQVTDVIRVDSLTNFQWVHGEGDEILVEPLIPYPDDLGEEGLTPQLLQERKDIAVNHPVIPRYLLSPDANTATFFLRLRPVFEGKLKYKQINNDVRKITGKYHNKDDLEIHITGSGAFPAAFEEITYADLKFLVPLLIAAIFFLLLFIFRSFLGVVLPLIIIILTAGSTLGIAGWLGIKFDPMTSAIPEILIAICLADCIHILTSFYMNSKNIKDKKEAILQALAKNVKPTLLTSFSTAIGFFSVANSDIFPIKNLGLLAGIGTMLAWVLSYTLIAPALVYFGKSKKIHDLSKESAPSPFIDSFVALLVKTKKPILLISILLSTVATYLAFQNEINSDVNSYFADDVPVRQANEFMSKHVGGSRGVEIVVETNEADGVKNPEILRKVQELSDWLSQQPHVTKVMSLVDIVKDINQSLHGNNKDYYKIPDTPQAVAEELFLYNMSLPAGTDLNYWTTLKNDKLRINVLWTIERSQAMVKEIKLIEDKANEIGLNAHVTGKTKLLTALNKYIVSTFFSSMAVAVLLISLLLMLVFKSIKLGLVAMIPNVLPPIFGGALMTLIDKPIDTGTVLVMAVCLGVAVDDTIHFLSDYHKQRTLGLDVQEAIKKVLEHTGKALIFTTVILVIGFGSFVMGHFVPSINFGMMTAVVLTLALGADLVLLPALFLLKKN